MKKIAIILAVLLVLIGGAWFALTAFIINSDEMAAELSGALGKATGRSVLVSKTAHVQLFPTPQVTFNGITVSNIEGASSPDFLSSPRFTIKLDMAALMTAKAKPSAIILDEAKLNLEVLPRGQKNWQFTGEQNSGFREYFSTIPVTLDKATLHFVNARNGSDSELGDISGDVTYEADGDKVVYNGVASIQGRESKVMARMSAVDMTGKNTKDTPVQLVVDHRGTVYKAQGTISSSAKDPEFIGQLEMESPNLWGAFSLFNGTESAAPAAQKAGDVTVNAKGDMTLSTSRLVLKDFAINASAKEMIPAIKGTVNSEYHFGKTPYLKIGANFETIDMDYLVNAYNEWFAVDATSGEDADGKTLLSATVGKDSPLEKFLAVASGEADIRVASLIFNGRSINGISAQTTMQPKRMTVRALRASMPGETRLVSAGIVSTRPDGLAFDGKFEMQGREMEQFLSLFTPKDVTVPALDLGLFGIRTNLSLDAEQYRFSEFQARVADTRMAGVVILHRGDRPKLESFLRIAKINLDVVSKAVQFMLPESEGVKSSSKGKPGDDLFDVQYSNAKFNWLASVGFDIDSNFLIEDFVLFARQGKRAEFHLGMGVGKVQFDKINADYSETKIRGAAAMQVEQGKNPSVTANLDVSELNMVDLFPDLARDRNEDEWKAFLKEPLTLMLLQTYRAKIKAHLGKLNIRKYTFEDVDTEVTPDNNLLTVEKFTGKLWNGGANIRMAIQAGTIPSMSFSFALANVNLIRLSDASALFKHSAGLMAAQGQLSTSGITPRSWFDNAKGEIRVHGSDVSVQGFGISTLARAVPVARQVRDVEQAKALALRGGVTRFSALDGMVNIDQGHASTPRMNYTGAESNGSVTGSVDLVNESVDLLMKFTLNNTRDAGEDTPVVSLKLEGPIDSVKKELDTQALENYVAQRSAQRALGKTR